MSDHAPIEPGIDQVMINTMRQIDVELNGQLRGKHRTYGVVMFVFPYNDYDGRFNYISNGANRKDIAKLMREQAAKFEAMGESK